VPTSHAALVRHERLQARGYVKLEAVQAVIAVWRRRRTVIDRTVTGALIRMWQAKSSMVSVAGLDNSSS